MSFEGYYQVLCTQGHLTEADCYALYGFAPKDWKCPDCGNPCAWWNLVDETNGTFDPETQERIDGYTQLEPKEPPKPCVCKECGHNHMAKKATYKVPVFRGHRL